MSTVLVMASRNIRVYVRNRMSVFFSFLSVIIIIALYALFLGKVQTDGITAAAGGLPGVRWLVDSWIMAGLLAVNAVTLPLGVLGTMVFDKEYKRFPDFLVAPVRRTSIVVSYLISAWVISLLFSLVAFVAGELYIVAGGGRLLGPHDAARVVGMLALDVVSSSSIMFLIASFLTSGSAFGALSTILGTLIGFITGVYVPLGILPEAVQKFVVLLPFTHSAAMLRQAFCEAPLAVVFGNVPPALRSVLLEKYDKMYGVKIFWGRTEISMLVMVAVVAGAALAFLLLSTALMRSRKSS
jgi:multidrug/hemolysin transport system permease protein